ncbi:Anti-sigma regulatory factor (Ser/Thr protein kinase) [Streptomyces indicus]|uniref:Anti-sigma regulatory factor (Ser/Thr protein kinase) n=1 Tax=Streptomyces indicus TaxID=417292 RepID=A0A1G9FZV3_9ACTN|nr:Anti-sigma regulatory factor (Ser/Thr protein kinase) [Streptomyces indicus]
MKPDRGSGSSLREVIGVIETEGDRAEWTFPADPTAVRTARAVVRKQLAHWGLTTLGDVTVLLVSELVTNSLRYASGPIGVRLVRPVDAPGVLRVEVSDPLPDPPLERKASLDDEGGRGLQLVACSASRWGTRQGHAGKTVWFELTLPV